MLDAAARVAGKKLAGMSAAALAAAAAYSLPAQALIIPQIGIASGSNYATCAITENMTPNAASPSDGRSHTSKSDAILGGAQSALDRIRQQQARLEPVAETRSATSAQMAPHGNCSALFLAIPRMVERSAPAMSEENFLASTRIAIRQTSFTDQWNRVAGDTITFDEASNLIGERDASKAGTLQSVNRWVNNAIAYAQDRELWHSRDYWASASQTLGLREGDCEDIAIVKYQILRALGVAPQDMFLTLARDLARNADHALLVVRHEGRFFLLDNATDAILPADLSYDYRPTLSFSGDSAWLHGMVGNRAQHRPILSFGQGDVETARDGFQEIG